jgi:hypothetical protein
MCSYRHKKWILNWSGADYFMLIFIIVILILLGVNAYENCKRPSLVVDLPSNP